MLKIENDDAFVEGKRFAVSEGILVGISSGADTATILAETSKGKNIVVLLRIPVTDTCPHHYLQTKIV